MKPSHHGNRTSSSEPFVRAVNPRVGVISVQPDSRFGHPRPLGVERYRTLGARIFRTDKHGAITVRTDDQSVWIEPYSGGPAVLGPPVTPRVAETHTPPAAAPRW
jgi:competence protein ComEC